MLGPFGVGKLGGIVLHRGGVLHDRGIRRRGWNRRGCEMDVGGYERSWKGAFENKQRGL